MKPEDLREGVVPPNGVLLQPPVSMLIRETPPIVSEDWAFYRIKANREGTVVSLKLVALEPVVFKANYRLYYNMPERRFILSSDYLKLLKHGREKLASCIEACYFEQLIGEQNVSK